jgi:hypothetical protein
MPFQARQIGERFERNPRLGRHDHRSNVPVVVEFGQVKAEDETSKVPSQAEAHSANFKDAHPVPPRWRETYDTVKEMCSHIVAPVDTMVCDQAQLKEITSKVSLHLVIKNPPRKEVVGGRISASRPLCLLCCHLR